MPGVCCIVALLFQQSAATTNIPVNLSDRTTVAIPTSTSESLPNTILTVLVLEVNVQLSFLTDILKKKKKNLPNISSGQLSFKNHHINAANLAYTERSELPAQHMYLEM